MSGFLICGNYCISQENEVATITKTAEEQVSLFLEEIPEGKENLFGFNNRNEFDHTSIGKPYKIYTLIKEFYIDSLISEDNYFEQINEWFVPIVVNSEYRMLATVALTDGTWEVVGIGSAGLARELEGFEKKYPSSYKYGILLSVFPVESDFVVINNDLTLTTGELYPLSSAVLALGNQERGLSSLTIIKAIALIKDFVRQ